MPSSDNDVIAEVTKAEQQRSDAITARDWATVERIYGDDFTYTHSTGRREGKDGQLNTLKNKDRTIELSDFIVRPYGDVAVTQGKHVFRFGPQPAGSPEVVELEVMQVWTKRNGEWQIVAHQGTKLK